jgi:hypothetical protein
VGEKKPPGLVVEEAHSRGGVFFFLGALFVFEGKKRGIARRRCCGVNGGFALGSGFIHGAYRAAE